MAEIDQRLPGAELVEAGLADIARGETTVEALLVAIAAPRLRGLGIAVPASGVLPGEPEIELYRVLQLRHGDDAHGRYNALVRRLVSFERALERERVRDGASTPATPKVIP